MRDESRLKPLKYSVNYIKTDNISKFITADDIKNSLAITTDGMAMNP